MLSAAQHAAIFEEVSARMIERRAMKLAALDRRIGSVQLRQACEILAAELDAIGVHRLDLSSFAFGPNKRYFDWTTRRRPFAESAELWLERGDGRQELICRTSDDASCLIGALRSTAGGGERFELVDVGAGTRALDYKSRRVGGRVALAWGPRPRAAMLEALIERKAAGVLLGPFEEAHAEPLELDAPAAYGGLRPFAFHISETWLQRIQGLLAGGDELHVRVALSMTVGEAELPVLSATLRGSETEAMQTILVETSYDQRAPALQAATAIEAVAALSRCVAKKTLRPAPHAIRLLLVPGLQAVVAWLAQREGGAVPAHAALHLTTTGAEGAIELLEGPSRRPSFIADHAAALLDQLPGLPPIRRTAYRQGSGLLPWVTPAEKALVFGLGLTPTPTGPQLARETAALASCVAEIAHLDVDDAPALLASATIHGMARLSRCAADIQRRARTALSGATSRAAVARHYLWLGEHELGMRQAKEATAMQSALDYVGAGGITALGLAEARADLQQLTRALTRTLAEELLAVIPKKSAATPKRGRITPIQRRAAQKIVIKCFSGPLPLPALSSDLKHADRVWLAHHHVELDRQPVGDVLMQWVDGKRTIAEIHERLCLDRPDADLRLIWRYLEALEGANIVKLVEKSDDLRLY